MTLKIGNAPCSWGVEFADDPRNPSWESVLDECAAAGFEGIDLGPVGFFPEDPAELKDALTSRALTLTSGVVFRPFHDPGAEADCRDVTIRTCRILSALGAKELVLIDSIASKRSRTLGRPHKAPILDTRGWSDFHERIETAARIGSEDCGLTVSVHPHAGGYCDFEEELDRLLSEIDADTLKVCIDSGHATLAGMDPLALLRKYSDRIALVHLKDIDPIKKAAVVRDGTEFYTACADSLFCQMGKGDVDFRAFRNLLGGIGYVGWCTVEQDCAPNAHENKVEIACANRNFLRSAGF